MIKTPLSTVIGGAFWTPGATILGSSSQNLNQLIKSLFASSEQGFAYDPNDLTTLYQDAAGTIPVTAVGQPVGLMKDKSGRNNHAYQSVSASRPILRQTPIFGSKNSTVNGDFSDGLTGWVNVTNWWSNVSGRAYHPLTSTYSELKQSISNAVGKLVEVTFDIEVLQGAAMVGVTGDTNVLKNYGVGKATHKFTQTLNAASYFVAARYNGINSEFYIDNISIKEAIGYRIDQNYLKFDGVDDKLTTTLPTQLTDCTVVRSVPNVDTQILTGQTVPTIYNDNIDNCGLIVINRALTASETSQITKLFNKAAGVML
jgi:hypothetical protein